MDGSATARDKGGSAAQWLVLRGSGEYGLEWLGGLDEACLFQNALDHATEWLHGSTQHDNLSAALLRCRTVQENANMTFMLAGPFWGRSANLVIG